MRQNKLLLLLVLLMTAATGAWADSFSADAYAANATLNGVSVSTNQTVTINEGVTVTVNNGLSIQSNATLTVTGGGTLVVNGNNGADGQNSGWGVDPQEGDEVWVNATPGGDGNSGIVIDNGGNLIISNATIIAVGGKGGQGGKDGDESYAANGADGNGFASFPTIDGAVLSYSTNGTDYTEYASGNSTLYRYMKAVAAAAAPTYKITVAEGTEDAGNWKVKVGEGEAKAFPVEGLNGGETVTVTYSGEKKVKSVKAVKKAAAPAPAPITVTINQEDWGWGSITKGGVTVSAGDIDPTNGNIMNDGTFSTTLGNFTKIVVTAKDCNFSGTGWSGNSSSMTWAGTPASTVPFSGNVNGHSETKTTIVCTIVPTN